MIKYMHIILSEVTIDKTKTFCPVAGCEGVCTGMPGVSQQSHCKEVSNNLMANLNVTSF